ncbi:hypothetical protein JCM5353_001055 [Sporobolomyces roseus]
MPRSLRSSAQPPHRPGLPGFHNFQVAARAAPTAYQSFVDAVNDLVQRWGPAKEYQPGPWRPEKFGDNLKTRLDEYTWTSLPAADRKCVLKMLKSPDAIPNLFSRNFMKETTRRALSTIEHLKKTDSAPDPERFFLLLNDRRKKLETLLQTNTDYHRWVVRLDKTIRRNWYRILQEEKGYAVIGYLQACFEILKEVQDTMSTPTRGPPLPLIKYYRPTSQEFFELCGLVPYREYERKAFADDNKWSMFVARNRLSTNPFVLDPYRRAHPLPLSSLSLDQLVDLVESVAERYRNTYGEWGYIVGSKLNELVEEAKASDHVNAYYRLGDYLQSLLACTVGELPSPENIPSTISQITVPPYTAYH